MGFATIQVLSSKWANENVLRNGDKLSLTSQQPLKVVYLHILQWSHENITTQLAKNWYAWLAVHSSHLIPTDMPLRGSPSTEISC